MLLIIVLWYGVKNRIKIVSLELFTVQLSYHRMKWIRNFQFRYWNGKTIDTRALKLSAIQRFENIFYFGIFPQGNSTTDINFWVVVHGSSEEPVWFNSICCKEKSKEKSKIERWHRLCPGVRKMYDNNVWLFQCKSYSTKIGPLSVQGHVRLFCQLKFVLGGCDHQTRKK